MSVATALLGNQSPRIAFAPSHHWSAADDAAFLATSYGLTPDQWQFDVIAAWLGEDRKGRLTAGRCGLAVPRQNGKNGIVEVVELYKIVVQGRRILHTAHEVKTARKAFMRLKSFFENERKWPELAALAKDIRQTNGQEAIVLHASDCEPKGYKNSGCGCANGGSVEFVARSRGSGRGFTVDDLVLDEAQDLTDEQLEALLPTISAAPSGDPQQIYLGTPPGPRSPGDVFLRLRREGVKRKAKRLSWHEWSIADDLAYEDAVKRYRELTADTNPALGRRLNMGTVEDELGAMSPEGFCRERLGQWADEAAAGPTAFDPKKWGSLAIKAADVPTEGRKSYGVVFAWDGSGVALAAALRPADGPVHVEAIRQAPMGDGTRWLVDWLVERHREAAQIVIYGKGMAEALVNDLRDEGVRNKKLVLVPAFGEVVAAHAMLDEAVKTGAVTHLEDPLLDGQALIARKQPIGRQGGFGWTAPDDKTVLMLNAATFAHWGAKTTKRNPSKTGRGVKVL